MAPVAQVDISNKVKAFLTLDTDKLYLLCACIFRFFKMSIFDIISATGKEKSGGFLQIIFVQLGTGICRVCGPGCVRPFNPHNFHNQTAFGGRQGAHNHHRAACRIWYGCGWGGNDSRPNRDNGGARAYCGQRDYDPWRFLGVRLYAGQRHRQIWRR
jgi:hypothetical protein